VDDVLDSCFDWTPVELELLTGMRLRLAGAGTTASSESERLRSTRVEGFALSLREKTLQDELDETTPGS